MNLESTYFVSQIVSSVVVLVSVIYLALQVRQAERNQRAQIHAARTAHLALAAAHYAEPHIRPVMARVLAGEADFSEEECLALGSFLRIVIINFEDANWHLKAGLLDQRTMEHSRQSTRLFLSQPAIRALWETMRSSFGDQVVETVTRDLIDGVPVQAIPSNSAAAIKAKVEEYRRQAA